MSHSDRTARLVQDGGKAFEAGELIKTKLDRVIKKITEASDHAKKHGRLSPDEQYAVRIVRSKQRLIDREWHAMFGMGKARADALVELAVTRTDDGTLIKYGEKMHAQGRLNCTACTTTAEEDTLIPVPASRLCPYCKAGIEHVYDTRELVAVDGTGIHVSGDPAVTLPEGGKVPEKLVYTRHFHCDCCDRNESVVL